MDFTSMGTQVLETDIYYRTPIYDGKVDYPVTLQEDEVFVLCDTGREPKTAAISGR